MCLCVALYQSIYLYKVRTYVAVAARYDTGEGGGKIGGGGPNLRLGAFARNSRTRYLSPRNEVNTVVGSFKIFPTNSVNGRGKMWKEGMSAKTGEWERRDRSSNAAREARERAGRTFLF